MDETTRVHFEKLKQTIRTNFENVQIARSSFTEQRALLDVYCTFKGYRVRIFELIDRVGRSYAYYVFQGDEIIAGFDNAPDGDALRQKYGNDFGSHRTERIPHAHGRNKETLSLTAEMTYQAFWQWIQQLLPVSDNCPNESED